MGGLPEPSAQAFGRVSNVAPAEPASELDDSVVSVSSADSDSMRAPASSRHHSKRRGALRSSSHRAKKSKKDAGSRRMRFVDEVSAAEAVPEPEGRVTRSKRREVERLKLVINVALRCVLYGRIDRHCILVAAGTRKDGGCNEEHSSAARSCK